MNTADTIRAYWAAMNSNDFASAARLLAPNVIIDWPQSDERIIGRDDFSGLNHAYPASGAWKFNIISLLAQATSGVTVTDVTDGEMSARVITLHEVDPETGLILSQVEYWPDTYPAPSWRKAWVHPMPTDHPHGMA